MLIGISGVAGAGKDTCADFLVRKENFVKVSLADPIKRAARDIFAFSEEQLWGPSAMRNASDERYPRYHTMVDVDGFGYRCACCGRCLVDGAPPREQCLLTPRYALQQFGTEYGRHCYAPIWIEYTLRVAKKLSEEDGWSYTPAGGPKHEWVPGRSHVVVPDVRFKNEVDVFKLSGAKLIRIARPGAGLGGGAGAHASEIQQQEIPDVAFDAVIVNDGTLEELEEKVVQFVRLGR